MKISDVGEFGIIRMIQERLSVSPENVVVGIGDDGAVYRTTPGREQVAVIDTMVEGEHFIIHRTATWHAVGYKAVAANLSDLAAMGAVPTQAVVSTALAPTMEVSEVLAMYEGMQDICRTYGVNIIGGDTVMAKESAVITVTALGEVEAGRALLRSGAKAGDIVAVSHTLGDAGAGLDVLLSGTAGYESLVRAHQYPVPQIQLGRILAAHHGGCANDISDGIAGEANEIAKASHADLVLYAESIPVSAALRQWCAQEKKDVFHYVLQGGEDYELIFTLPPETFSAVRRQFPNLTPIGRVCAGTGRVRWVQDGKESIVPPHGWTHF
ncbi:thiamine-phosphate kinase [uncultured Megasphaera sp.]|uniref:thiamine-phosphate kinase n=1 Tax=uncultured Megasphaera sp. TaxID=165188 RepID=UPI0025997863|nr:thiamine-phosphate kinase [uncultured Megasphaera sp.]